MGGTPTKHLLVTPCDPGYCHIYFGVQRNAFATALALATATNRTLILPPIEYYENQAQQATSVFTQTEQARRPRFVRWSEIYDIDALRRAGVQAVEYFDLPTRTVHFDRALLQNSGPSLAGHRFRHKRMASASAPDGMHAKRCAIGTGAKARGLLANLSRSQRPLHSATGTLYGRQVTFGELHCGYFPLHPPGTANALRAWLAGTVHVAAIFNVGHLHTMRFVEHDSTAPQVAATVSAGVHLPAPALAGAADRFVKRLLLHGDTSQRSAAEAAPGTGATPRFATFVSVHWRHGDYMSLKGAVTPPATVVRLALRALQEVQCHDCPVFLMTNCRSESALAEVRRALPTLVMYKPPKGSRLAEEGPRLMVEQVIASQAGRFVGTQTSSVSEYVQELLEWRRAKAKAVPMEGAPRSPLAL